jgi:hypothetical protein
MLQMRQRVQMRGLQMQSRNLPLISSFEKTKARNPEKSGPGLFILI